MQEVREGVLPSRHSVFLWQERTVQRLKQAVGSAGCCTLLAERSRAMTVPVSPMSCATAVVLPPGAAHMSSTLDPGWGLSAWKV